MQLKDYQNRALSALDEWLRKLDAARRASREISSVLEAVGHSLSEEDANWPKKTWEGLRSGDQLPISQSELPYKSRTTSGNDPIPHACLKIPTGGGKTLLGAAAVERILMHSGEQTGLLLWMVPTTAIFEQTKKTLWDRQHPYRQWLERACGGRVKVMEKDDPLTYDDVKNYLCVMLVRLQATNRRKSKDFLRMFRNSGRYPGFFPADDDHPLAQGEFREEHPHLEREADMEGYPGIVKQSLINVFKLCRPIVILDEAHKAYGRTQRTSEEFAVAINRMDPSIVVELSATPNSRISNVLVDIQGTDLQAEEMIKLPIQVETRSEAVGWHHTLGVARERLEDLTSECEALESDAGRYIRPIAVVRVERTGRNQRDGINIHSEDVREHLISVGVQPGAIKVKSSELDELRREDLVNEKLRSPVTWIITKDALKEGWDCPFAYILVLLDTTSAKTAVTQMVGRVLRMPHAQLTGRPALDRCYVICHNAEVRDTVNYVRAGLENEGLGDLGGFVRSADFDSDMRQISLERRNGFRGQRIFLPKVLHLEGQAGWRDLDYDRDILADIDWDRLSIDNVQGLNVTTAVGGTALVNVRGGTEQLDDIQIETDEDVDITYFARGLASVVPNPWLASHLSQDAIDELIQNNVEARFINANRSRYSEQFRSMLTRQIDEQAKDVFVGKFENGEIRFDLEADTGNYEVCEEYQRLVASGEVKLAQYAEGVQRSLFEPVLASDFNTLERRFAFYLDGRDAILWWHRVAASQRGGYFLRGWRRDRIFPDFVAMANDSGATDCFDNQLLLFETKGAHLEHSTDTEYKQSVLSYLEQAYNGELEPQGTMTLNDGVPKGVFRMVFERDLEEALAGTVAGE